MSLVRLGRISLRLLGVALVLVALRLGIYTVGNIAFGIAAMGHDQTPFESPATIATALGFIAVILGGIAAILGSPRAWIGFATGSVFFLAGAAFLLHEGFLQHVVLWTAGGSFLIALLYLNASPEFHAWRRARGQLETETSQS